MKHLKRIMIAMSLFGLSLTGCVPNSIKPGEDYSDDARYQIYLKAKEDGYTGTYEEWLESIKGHTPVITVGDNGNWYIDGVDTGVQAQGVPGPKGTDGQPGQDGTSLLTGEGAPGANLGKVGDSYIDLASWNFYVKEQNGWALKGNIKGSDGQGSGSVVDDNPQGLAFYPLNDGTYGVAVGEARYLKDVVVPATYKGKNVTAVIEEGFGRGSSDDPALYNETITLPNTITSIAKYAFEGAYIKSVNIPKSVTFLGERAFTYCEYLESVTYAGTIEEFKAIEIEDGSYLFESSAIDVVTCSDGEYKYVPPAPPEDHNLTIWCSFGTAYKTAIQEVMDQYMTDHPGSNVTIESKGGYDNLHSAIEMAIPAGTQPDIIFQYNDYIADYTYMNAVADLSSYVNTDEEFKNDCYSSLLKIGSQYCQEGIYSLPFQINSDVLYYNKTALVGLDLSSIDNEINNGQPLTTQYIEGLSYSELFTKLLPAIKTYDETHDIYSGSAPLQIDYASNFLYEISKQFGYPLDSIDPVTFAASINFNNDNNKNIVKNIKSSYDAGLFTIQGLNTSAYGSNEFTQGNILFSISTSGGMNYYRTDNFEPGVSQLPLVEGSTIRGMTQGASFAVLKKSSHPEHVQQAYDLYKYLVGSSELFFNLGYLPVTKSQKTAIGQELENIPETEFPIYRKAFNVVNQNNIFGRDTYSGCMRVRNEVDGLLIECLGNSDLTTNIDSIFTKYYNRAIMYIK